VAGTLARTLKRGVTRVAGRKFVKHYLDPLRVRGVQAPFDAKRYFESWHRASGSLEDSETIAPGASPLRTAYHYNAVENAIMESLAGRTLAEPLTVLDVGSGAGHWIDFYRRVFGASSVVGLELSALAVESLQQKYADEPGVEIVEGDVSGDGFALGRSFGLVNAVGVMFHVVDDARWQRAVANVARHLEPGGLAVVTDQFGLVTRNVQFHRRDEFSSWEELRSTQSDVALVNKRIRSLRAWRACADAAGLEVVERRRARTVRAIPTPENNVLLLRKPG
jgi:SAM-dependent methyltransferase